MSKLQSGEGQPDPEQTGGKNIKGKLKKLKEYLPGQTEQVYDFADFLSTRAHDKLLPKGFDLMAKVAIYDLQTGIDGFSGEPFVSKLSGNSPQVIEMLSKSLPQIKKVLYGNTGE